MPTAYNCSERSRSNRDVCARKVITNYVRVCAQAGVSLGNWEAQTRCNDLQQTCTGKRQYKECGSRCQLTCSNYQSPPQCSKDCAPGCFCPDGQVLKGGACIDPKTCNGEYTEAAVINLDFKLYISYTKWTLCYSLGIVRNSIL